ncbi:MAG: Gfo/Idh/MocA family oxidoreductase [Anaerolineae bacterium]|nr:Gfo/Idh/MocA family oxidoreductase [Anaerolineae bacterium]
MPSPVRIVLIGAGRAGRVHANSLVHHVPNGQLVGLVDTVPETRDETGRMYGIESQFASLEAALDKLEFDAVVITTPTFTHKSLAVMAAEAGKHVFTEKPMALSLQECDLMIAAAAKNGVILQLGFMRRFSPEFVAAAERINAGEIGQPMLVKSLTHGPGLPPPWARDLSTSNGMLAEVNSHDWDCTRWLMGSNPDRVYVEVANFKGAARGVQTENFYDNVLVNIRFENGGLGSISGICPCDYGYDARVEIVGERGIMQIGDMQGQQVVVCTNRDQGLISPIYRTWPERFAWGYIREMEHFVHCIQTGTPPKVGGLDGRWAVAGVLAGTRSFLEARPVHVREVLDEGVTP